MSNSSHRIENEQQGFWQAVRALPYSSRLFIGLFVCALISWVSPAFLGNLLTLGQYGTRDFSLMIVNILAIVVLMGLNFIGHKIKRAMTIGIALSVPLLLWRILDTTFHMSPETLHHYADFMWWFVNILLGAMPLLNAALFLKFKQLTGLESKENS